MGRRLVVAVLLFTVCALLVVGMAVAAPDNKNSITIGMSCDHGVGLITGASIDQNSSGTLTIIEPGPGTYVVKRALINNVLVYENPGFAGRVDDLVRCVPM